MPSIISKAIFLQPTFTCGKDCDGCYVKTRESNVTKSEMPLHIISDFMDMLFSDSGPVYTEQFTFALDKLPSRVKHEEAWEKMGAAFRLFESKAEKESTVQKHITVNTIHDLVEYAPKSLRRYDMISISHLYPVILQDFRNSYVGKINWNVMAEEAAGMARSRPKELIYILRNVNSVNLLLHKAPLGSTGTRVKEYKQSIDLLWKLLSSNVEQVQLDGEACSIPQLHEKMFLDRCYLDGKKYNKSGTSCSAGISKFHVWPDGQVSGCPYNSMIQQTPYKTIDLDMLIENFFVAKQRSEFSNCRIPSDLVSSTKKLPVVI
jgi:hypothetical protein